MIAKVHATSTNYAPVQSGRAIRTLLLIDTCGVAGTIALACLEPAPVLVGQTELPGRSSSERLLPVISALLASQRSDVQALDAIAVVHGPGSFTGVRVGLSAAKGLCEALAIPLIAISRLAVLASKALSAAESGGLVVCLLDAGRNEYYAGEYRYGRCPGEALRTVDQLLSLKRAQPGIPFAVCEPNVMKGFPLEGVTLFPELSAMDALPLAVRRIAEGTFDDVATTDANYVRRTDTEIFAKAASPRVEGL